MGFRPIQTEGGVPWTSFSAALGATTTPPVLATTHVKNAAYRVSGKTLSLVWSYSHIFGTGATAGSGEYLLAMPGGYTIDTAIAGAGSDQGGFAYGTPVGDGMVMQDSAWGALAPVVHDANNLKFASYNVAGFSAFKFMGSAWLAFNVNNKKIMFRADVPIL